MQFAPPPLSLAPGSAPPLEDPGGATGSAELGVPGRLARPSGGQPHSWTAAGTETAASPGAGDVSSSIGDESH